uniref:Uncharacterized protein n=1 Tax=Anguilla anguilla TaxID=7936 RepID=A0A0E9XLG4_ANGAN
MFMKYSILFTYKLLTIVVKIAMNITFYSKRSLNYLMGKPRFCKETWKQYTVTFSTPPHPITYPKSKKKKTLEKKPFK